MARPVSSREGEYSKDVVFLTNLKRAVRKDGAVTESWREEVSNKLNDVLILLLDPETK